MRPGTTTITRAQGLEVVKMWCWNLVIQGWEDTPSFIHSREELEKATRTQRSRSYSTNNTGTVK